MLARLSIRAKVLGLVCALVLASTAVSVFIMSRIHATDTAYTEMIAKDVTFALRIERVRGDLANMGRQFNNVLLLQDPAGLPPLEASIRDISGKIIATLAEAEPLASPEDRTLGATLTERSRRVGDLATRLYALKRAGDHAAAAALYGAEGRPVVVASFNELAAVTDRIFARTMERKAEVSERAHGSIAVSSIALGLVALLSLVGGVWVAIGGVTRPIQRLSGRMTTLAGGDLAAEVPGTGRRDEVGAMARSVLGFRDGLAEADRLRGARAAAEAEAAEERRRAVSETADRVEASLGGVAQDLTERAEQLAGSTDQLSHLSDSTLADAGSAAAGATQTSANVQTVAAATEELATSVAEITRQVSHSSAVAGRAAEGARRTDRTVQALSDGAEKIGEVVRMITDIAGQTNLLALNATIEAARAGEAGRGFAVVASEVKTLAAQTARATEEIATQVGAMQGATREAVEAIRDIAATIEEVNAISHSIAAAVEQQGAATQEIARNVQQAALGTEEMSAGVQRVNRGAMESSAALGAVREAADGVRSGGDTLRRELGDLVRRLRVA